MLKTFQTFPLPSVRPCRCTTRLPASRGSPPRGCGCASWASRGGLPSAHQVVRDRARTASAHYSQRVSDHCPCTILSSIMSYHLNVTRTYNNPYQGERCKQACATQRPELAISLNSRYDDSPTGIFPMIQRSNARLKSLRLSYVGIEYSELYDVLRASPTLEELCLTDCTNYPAEDDVISILTIQSHTPEEDILCPRLSNISFSGWHIRNTRDTDRLVDMVESRWRFARSRNQPAVLSVNLTDNPSERLEFSSSRSKALARCISEGLEYTSKGRS